MRTIRTKSSFSLERFLHQISLEKKKNNNIIENIKKQLRFALKQRKIDLRFNNMISIEKNQWKSFLSKISHLWLAALQGNFFISLIENNNDKDRKATDR